MKWGRRGKRRMWSGEEYNDTNGTRKNEEVVEWEDSETRRNEARRNVIGVGMVWREEKVKRRESECGKDVKWGGSEMRSKWNEEGAEWGRSASGRRRKWYENKMVQREIGAEREWIR